jgi:hypothetical protein
MENVVNKLIIIKKNTHTHTVGFETTISVLFKWKTTHTLDQMANRMSNYK